jgi:hypothetical protein
MHRLIHHHVDYFGTGRVQCSRHLKLWILMPFLTSYFRNSAMEVHCFPPVLSWEMLNLSKLVVLYLLCYLPPAMIYGYRLLPILWATRHAKFLWHLRVKNESVYWLATCKKWQTYCSWFVCVRKVMLGWSFKPLVGSVSNQPWQQILNAYCLLLVYLPEEI